MHPNETCPICRADLEKKPGSWECCACYFRCNLDDLATIAAALPPLPEKPVPRISKVVHLDNELWGERPIRVIRARDAEVIAYCEYHEGKGALPSCILSGLLQLLREADKP